MCSKKHAYADEQKIARSEGSFAPPAMQGPFARVQCWSQVSFSHLQKASAKKMHVCTFLGICSTSENAKKLQKLFGSALSHLIICLFFDFAPGDCSRSL